VSKEACSTDYGRGLSTSFCIRGLSDELPVSTLCLYFISVSSNSSAGWGAELLSCRSAAGVGVLAAWNGSIGPIPSLVSGGSSTTFGRLV